MVRPTLYDPSYIPQRGDVVQISFDPQQRGFEMKKRRPALVISPEDFNRVRKVAIVCPITHTERQIDFEVEIPGGLEVSGFIRADQIMCLDWEQREAVLHSDKVPHETVDEVSDIIVEDIVWGLWGSEVDSPYIPM